MTAVSIERRYGSALRGQQQNLSAEADSYTLNWTRIKINLLLWNDKALNERTDGWVLPAWIALGSACALGQQLNLCTESDGSGKFYFFIFLNPWMSKIYFFYDRGVKWEVRMAGLERRIWNRDITFGGCKKFQGGSMIWWRVG